MFPLTMSVWVIKTFKPAVIVALRSTPLINRVDTWILLSPLVIARTLSFSRHVLKKVGLGKASLEVLQEKGKSGVSIVC